MSDGAAGLRPLLGPLVAAALAGPAAAEPVVTVLDLPFRVAAMRGPASEVAVSLATSGLLPLAKPRADGPAVETGEEASAPIVVVWGEGGGAALGLADGAIRTTLLGPEAIEGLAAAETPRGALPGSRRAVSGALSAYLTGPTRAAGVPGAAGLTIRERQSLGVTAEPKAVPVATATVSAGADSVFVVARPRALRLAGRPAFLAATLDGPSGSGLALIGHPAGSAAWSVLARAPVQPAAPMRIAAVADFTRSGTPQAATIRGDGVLQLWTLGPDRLTLAAEAPGYGAGATDAETAAPLEPEGAGPAELALPVAGGGALAVVALKGSVSERMRAPLPGPAEHGVAVLGRGAGARILVGLADGRVAVVAPEGTRP
jgi:hypothetical protein